MKRMGSIYILINMDEDDEEDDEVKKFNNLRVLSEYVRDIYGITKSHMYYQRSLNTCDKLYVERLLIIKIDLI